MLSMILRRLASAIPTLFMVAAVTFFLGLLAPGSPIDVIMGQHSSRAEIKRLEHLYGLDRPPLIRFGSYLAGAVHGDHGIQRGADLARQGQGQLLARRP